MFTFWAQCRLCRQPLYDSHHGICSHCLRRLPPPPCCCPRCGLPAASASLPCGRCLQHPPPWHALLSVSDYRPPLDGLIKQLKFYGQGDIAPALARLLWLCWRQRYRQSALNAPHSLFPPPDLLLTVPLHPGRQWRRGYNQTALLAAPLARWLNCRYVADGLTRTRPTPPQRSLTASARRRNLRGAFGCTLPLAGKRIVVLDDVVTTGSTMAEIGRVLLRQGAAHIQVWCLCRTL
ncbi:DNA utilization protein GntX [Lonsdalea quercina]|uniref:DNA utilization protein GntX n=1 Tax=Lonsdalea quercina TaxID=71657 RepID=UPI0039769E78